MKGIALRKTDLRCFINQLEANNIPSSVVRSIHALLLLKRQVNPPVSARNRQRPSSYKNWTTASVEKLSRLVDKSRQERGVVDWSQVETHFQGTGRTKRALISKYNSLRRRKH